MSRLRGDSRSVNVAFGYQITAPGLKGTVEKVEPGDEGFRGGSFLSEEFEEAVKRADLSTQAVFELKVAQTFVPEADPDMRAAEVRMVTREKEPAFSLTMPARAD